jgi:hypothetical protein
MTPIKYDSLNDKKIPIRNSPWIGNPIYQENIHISNMKKEMDALAEKRVKDRKKIDKTHKENNIKNRCLMTRLEGDPPEFKTYTCFQIKELKETWKKEFRENNRVDESRKDRYYDSFCESINEFLNQCKCQYD